eukprot:PhF_6_TR41728/c3_g1_i1/m.63316
MGCLNSSISKPPDPVTTTPGPARTSTTMSKPSRDRDAYKSATSGQKKKKNSNVFKGNGGGDGGPLLTILPHNINEGSHHSNSNRSSPSSSKRNSYSELLKSPAHNANPLQPPPPQPPPPPIIEVSDSDMVKRSSVATTTDSTTKTTVASTPAPPIVVAVAVAAQPQMLNPMYEGSLSANASTKNSRDDFLLNEDTPNGGGLLHIPKDVVDEKRKNSRPMTDMEELEAMASNGGSSAMLKGGGNNNNNSSSGGGGLRMYQLPDATNRTLLLDTDNDLSVGATTGQQKKQHKEEKKKAVDRIMIWLEDVRPEEHVPETVLESSF